MMSSKQILIFEVNMAQDKIMKNKLRWSKANKKSKTLLKTKLVIKLSMNSKHTLYLN